MIMVRHLKGEDLNSLSPKELIPIEEALQNGLDAVREKEARDYPSSILFFNLLHIVFRKFSDKFGFPELFLLVADELLEDAEEECEC